MSEGVVDGNVVCVLVLSIPDGVWCWIYHESAEVAEIWYGHVDILKDDVANYNAKFSDLVAWR